MVLRRPLSFQPIVYWLSVGLVVKTLGSLVLSDIVAGPKASEKARQWP